MVYGVPVNAAETRTTQATAALMLEIAQRIAGENTDRRMSAMTGDPRSEVIEWSHTCKVQLEGGVIWISIGQNRVLPKADSQALLNTVQKLTTIAWDAAGLLPNGIVKVRKFKGARVQLTGYWHMSTFSCTGRRMGFVVPTVAQECNAAAEVVEA
jgi:hypothetical protein